ncbi:hypothetical protein L9F63_018831, partial [Diploptera punctata]
ALLQIVSTRIENNSLQLLGARGVKSFRRQQQCISCLFRSIVKNRSNYTPLSCTSFLHLTFRR